MSEFSKFLQSLGGLITDPNVQRASIVLFVVVVAVIGIQVVFTLRAESQRKKARNAQRDKRD